MNDSPFNSRPKLLENNIGFVIFDGYPVSKGHCLIIPHRIYSNYFDSTEEEIIGLQKMLIETKKIIDKKYKPNGYNIGINCGEVSGQTVPHVLIHLIPRYYGDMTTLRWSSRYTQETKILMDPYIKNLTYVIQNTDMTTSYKRFGYTIIEICKENQIKSH